MNFNSFFKKILILKLLQLSFSVYADNKEIKLVTLEWEPYVGPNLKKQGFISELIRIALKKEGYTLKLEFMPWARALEQAEKSIDGVDEIMPKYYDKSILDKFIYSDSFFESTDGFYIKKSDKNKINYKYYKNDLNKTYDLLKIFKFGICRGYKNEDIFDSRNDLVKIDSTSDELNLINLVLGKVDLVFTDKSVAKFHIRNNQTLVDNLNNLEFLEPEIAKHQLFIAFSKKSKDIELKVKAFNKGLKSLIKEGKIKILKKDFDDFK